MSKAEYISGWSRREPVARFRNVGIKSLGLVGFVGKIDPGFWRDGISTLSHMEKGGGQELETPV